MFGPGVEATFLPAPNGRLAAEGILALWRMPPGEPPVGDDVLTVVIPRGRQFRRTSVSSLATTLGEAIPALVTLPVDAEVSPSVAAWASAVTTAVDLVARGRLLPGARPCGTPSWRVGPLDPADHRRIAAIAAALPPTAHAVAYDRPGPFRLPTAERLVEALLDAVADRLVRTAAAPAVGATPLSIGDAPDAAALDPALSSWLADAGAPPDDRAVPGLRLELPAGAEGGFRAVVQLRSSIDPSLVVDAADLWTSPGAVLARLGDHADTDLLVTLRRAQRSWPPVGRLLDQPKPEVLDLADDEAGELLGDAAALLGSAGLEVLWPTDLLADRASLRAVVGTPSPTSVTEAGLGFESLVEFRWEASVGDLILTDEEVTALAEAKRPLVRVRGRWVLADPSLAEKLRQRRRPLTVAEALTTALAGSIAVGGHDGAAETVAVRVEGPLADLVGRLTGTTGDREQPEPPRLEATLRPYQRRGLAWLSEMTSLGLGGCLADDMGLGKTVQVISLHLHRQETGHRGPALVVCPTTLLGNWERELGRFAPDVAVRRYHGGERHLDDLSEDEVVLATYGIVRRDHEHLATVGWGLVVADEAQHAKNPLARTAKALRAIPGSARVALTGTPVENRLSELWSILDWTTPGLLGPLESFQRHVAVPVERHRDAEVTAAFARMVRPFLLRRRKTDPGIVPELPPKTETDVVVPLTAEQVTLYQALVDVSLERIRDADGIDRRGLVLKLLTELKQACNHPAQLLGQRAPLTGRSGKLDALDELLEVILAAGDSVLVFSQYVAMQRLIERHLADRGVATQFLHGRVPPRQRDQMVERFQAGAVAVLLLSLKAGGTGLNLTRATHVVHYDRWWNPAVEDQASDRAWRIGQDRPVQVHRLVTEGTIEDRIATLLAAKRALSDAVVGGGEAWISELTDDELADLVSLRGPA